MTSPTNTSTPTPTSIPQFKQPTSIIIRRLHHVTPDMIHQQLLASAAILRITPFHITRYPIRDDAFVLKLELKHALALHNTLNYALTALFLHFSSPDQTKGIPSARGIISLPLPPVPTTWSYNTIDSAPTPTVLSTEAAPATSSWKSLAAPVSPDPIHWILIGLALTLFVYWMGYTLTWSSLRNTTAYGLCWHLALLAKAMATAWDLIDQTHLWREPLTQPFSHSITDRMIGTHPKILGMVLAKPDSLQVLSPLQHPLIMAALSREPVVGH